MVKNKYTDDVVPVEIDACYSCGGKFLDNDELALIRKQYEEEQDLVDNALKVRKYKPKGHTGIVRLFQAMSNKALMHTEYDE